MSRIVAVAMLLVGGLWLGQGMGLVRWPSSSFMIDQGIWAILGALLIVGGLCLLLRKRRL